MIEASCAGAVAAFAGVVVQDRSTARRCLIAATIATSIVAVAVQRLGAAPAVAAGCGALAVLAAVDARTTLVYDASVAAAYATVLIARLATTRGTLVGDLLAGVACAFVLALTNRRTPSVGTGDLLVLPLVPLALGAAAGFAATLAALLAALVARVVVRRAIPFLPFVALGSGVAAALDAAGAFR